MIGYARWRLDECYTALWVGKVINANWKAVSEAFMEAWHSIVTHPQILPFTGDANTRYSMWGDHANLALTPFGMPSPHLDGQNLTQDDIMAALGPHIQPVGVVGGQGAWRRRDRAHGDGRSQPRQLPRRFGL